MGVTSRAATLALVVATTAAHAEPMQVVVVKRAGVMSYEEVAEEFGERCRVRARVVSLGDDGLRGLRFGVDDVVVTVGQEALDAVRGSRARVIPTLAFFAPEGLVGPPASPHPELILKVLAVARGAKIRTVGVVYGPRTAGVIAHATKAAERLGLTLVASPVKSGPEAVRALHTLADKVDALWLPGDSDVVTTQVFQYALRLQLERGLPLAAATRQQVHSGALVAADFSPRAAGRIAADLANRYLDGHTTGESPEIDLFSGARVTVNAVVARRMRADVEALMRMGARFE
ncbi:MAG: transporter substrate-binding protein [Myxococcales bacterium]|nr:transporter substrate-binding protein [Myxococcales bacterium]